MTQAATKPQLIRCRFHLLMLVLATTSFAGSLTLAALISWWWLVLGVSAILTVFWREVIQVLFLPFKLLSLVHEQGPGITASAPAPEISLLGNRDPEEVYACQRPQAIHAVVGVGIWGHTERSATTCGRLRRP